MNITENNTLIAEFMEWVEKYPDDNILVYYLPRFWCEDFKITEEFEALEPQEMLFHESCDWLIPVIEKIQVIADNPTKYLKECVNIEFDISLSAAACELKIDSKRIAGQTAFEPGTLINAVYLCVIEFIKWYHASKGSLM